MSKLTIVCIVLGLVTVGITACKEMEEGVDNNNDIIVRNMSESNLWIKIDGAERGHIDNDGIAETMWNNIADGYHILDAYRNDNYTYHHCSVGTNYLEDGDDFTWYLEEDDQFSGSKDGEC